MEENKDLVTNATDEKETEKGETVEKKAKSLGEKSDKDKGKKNAEPVVKKTESVKAEQGQDEDDSIEITDVDKMAGETIKTGSSSNGNVDKRKINKATKKRNSRALKKLRKWIIILVILGIVIFVAVRYASYTASQAASKATNATTYAQVEKMDLASTISTTGTIQSKDVRTLTSALNGVTIENVNYKVGDMVNEGEVVVTFSKDDISKKIADLEEDIVEAQTSLNLTNEYKAKEHAYDYGTASYNNYTAAVKTEDAQISLDQAQRNLNEACQEKSEYVEKYNNALANIDGVTAELEEVQKEYEIWKAYIKSPSADPTVEFGTNLSEEEQKKMYASMMLTYSYLTTDDAWQNKISELTNQKSEYKTLIDNYDSKISSYSSSIENAQDKLLSAQRSLTSTTASQSETVRNTTNNIVTSDYNYAKDSLTASDNLTKLIRDMEEYEQSLDDYIVFAPITGLVTAVNAQEGNGYTANTGALMTIQAVDVYEVTTQIDEYDINNVEIGQKVVIMTDATGDDELDGVVTFISPTATSGTSSNTYEVKIDIKTVDKRIKLGMSAKINIILDSHSDILAVRYDAIEEGTNGEKYVYVVNTPSAPNFSKNFQKKDSSSDSDKSDSDNGILVVGSDGSSVSGDKPQMPQDGEMPDFTGNKKQSFLSYLFDFSSNNNDGNMPSDASGLSSAAKKVTVEIGIEGDYYTEIISNEISEGMTVTVKSNNDKNSNSFDFDSMGGFGGGMGGGAPSGGGPGGGGPGM